MPKISIAQIRVACVLHAISGSKKTNWTLHYVPSGVAEDGNVEGEASAGSAGYVAFWPPAFKDGVAPAI